MKRQDKVAFWLFFFLIISLIKIVVTKHNYAESVGSAIVFGLLLWPITCYKRIVRAKITTIVSLVLVLVLRSVVLKFDLSFSFADDPFHLMFVVSSFLWWHASRNDKKSALKD